MRVLLVEDDPMIGESVQQGVRQDGFAVDWVQDGEAAELALRTTAYTLVLLDLGLPHKNGLEVLATLRRTGRALPVLILTARDAVADRVQGLDSGADDYLVKPFALEELAARIRALLRRQHGRAEPLLVCGSLALNPATHQVMWRGAEVALASREFAVLQALLERPGAVLSRALLPRPVCISRRAMKRTCHSIISSSKPPYPYAIMPPRRWRWPVLPRTV